LLFFCAVKSVIQLIRYSVIVMKTLRMYYSSKELAAMMDMSYNTFRAELRRNCVLHRQLTAMGWSNYKRLCKAHVLEIFKVLGYP